jgi:transcription factor IIIB subunit 2
MNICLNCRSSNIEYDSAQGNSFCADCGAVLEENTVVSEVTFAELANGASVLQGQFISSEKGRAMVPNIFGRRMGPLGGTSATALSATDSGPALAAAGIVSESREITLASGKRRLAAVAVALGLGEHHVDMAHRWFTLALQHQFTRGRRSNNIIASCLYIVCRMERTPHMLLDFSDILQTSVYSLGGTFLRLIQLLNLELPLVDPSFYIGRFAARLDFAEKTQNVVNSALRVAARMKRDWIVTGRRPAGVCAAALIVAARMHSFRRTERQVVRIVHICEATLKRRLSEFAATPSSQLSPEEFEGIWLEQECDPPSFLQNRLRAAQKTIEPESIARNYTQSQNENDSNDESLSVASSELPVKGQLDHEVLGEIRRLQAQPKTVVFDADLALLSPPLTPRPVSLEKGSSIFFENNSNPENLSDLDSDEDVQGMLLDAAEIDAKTSIWSEVNREFLDAQAEIERLERENATKATPDPLQTVKRPRKRRGKSAAGDGPSERRFTKTSITGEPVAETAAEATKQALASKKLSKKINYDALQSLMTK